MSGDVDYPQGCLPIENSTNVSQQIERLRKLAACLYDCKPNNSEEVKSPTRFTSLFHHLSKDCFLDNSNTDFRIYLSLCLANVIRVFQPEVPTATAIELKDVYVYLFRTLRGLGDVTTDSPKFKHYYHLAEAIEKILHPISEMKDFDDKEAIPVYRHLFKELFIIPCGKGWQKNLQKHEKQIKKQSSSDKDDNESQNPRFEDDDDDEEDAVVKIKQVLVRIGTTAISELDFVPNEVLDVIFYHVANPQRANFPEARLLVEDIINACLKNEIPNQLSHSIHNAITAAAKEGQFSDEFELTGSNNRSKFFDLLRFLHYVEYDLVSGAIQELNFWLQSENEVYRKEAVNIVGILTRDRHCQFGMDSNDATWAAFLNAAMDRDDSVRWEFVKQSKEILNSNHSHLRGHIINGLLRLSKDTNDDIRVEVVTTVTEVAKSKLEAISDKMLKACAERMKDKKPKVRIHAIKYLMDLYYHIMTSHPQPVFSRDGLKATKEIKIKETPSPYTESDKECVRFIPSAVFNVYRLTQRVTGYHDARLLIERYLQLYFVPYKTEAKKRVQMMAELYRNLDDIGCMMFGDVINRSSQLRRAMIGILSQVGRSTEMTPESSAQLKERIRRICQIFPESGILEKLMMTFVNQMAENEEIFNLVKKLMSESYTSEENVNSAVALKSLVESKIAAKTHQAVFRHFIDRIVPVSFDVHAAKELVELISETVFAKVDLKNWAQNCFERDLSLLKVFTDHFGYLFADETIVEKIRSKILSSEEPRAVEAALHAISKIFANSSFRQKCEDESTRKERWFLSIIKDLKELVMRDEPELRRSCKLATRLLASLLGKQKAVEFFDSQIETLFDRLHLHSEGAANSFQVLAEVFQTDVPHYLNQIMDVVESDKIGPSILTSQEHSDDDPIDFNELIHMDKQPWPKLTMAKVYAAKFATKVLVALPLLSEGDERRQMERAAQKFVDFLSEIIEKKGDLGGKQCDLEKARLRSTAAGCLLKLASVLTYRTKVHTRLFKNMSYMIADETYCVRLYYALHVKKGLSRRLPIEFSACYGLINLGLIEEEGENKMDGFKTICLNQALQAFVERNEERANQFKLEGAQRAVFCAETVIAYVVWLLANYDKLESVEDNANKNDSEEELQKKVSNVNLLAELQESLWLVIDTLKMAKCNMQKVWKVLEKLKTCGDKPMRADGGLHAEHIRQHNKKLWALCDLGITMMLYRAKLQMEDQESKEVGFNLQFFYVCGDKDRADPSNVYAPDILINDEKHRNGRLPKPGRVFHASDLTAEFSPPPQNNETAASTSLKNISKRSGANTSNRKRGAGKTTKRRSGGSKVSDDDDDDTKAKSPPVLKKRRSKRGTYDLPEEEDDEELEVIPLPKRRGAPAVSSAPSSSSANGISTRNGTAALKQENSRGAKRRQDSKRETEIENDSDEEKDERVDDVSLDNLVISPILNESSGRSRRSARNIAATATITASTPLVTVKPKSIKRKRSEAVVEEEEEVEEDIEEPKEKPSPKKRTSGRRAPQTPSKSPKKTSTAPIKKAAAAATTNGTSPKKNKYGLPMEEEETVSTSQPSLRTRTSARLSKK